MDTGWKAGLEDVIAARSGICQVDGERGKLYYRGYEIADVAGALSFEDVTALLWHGEVPSAAQSAPVAAQLQTLPRDAHPLDALRTAVSLAATRDPDVRSNEPDANLRKAFRLMNLIPETVAAWQRIRTGRAPVAARRAAPHAAYFLELLDGKAPSSEVASVMDLVLTLHADHELNASTFAARVGVATLTDLHAAIAAAVATLKGPKHGGANEDVLAMLLEIGEP